MTPRHDPDLEPSLDTEAPARSEAAASDASALDRVLEDGGEDREESTVTAADSDPADAADREEAGAEPAQGPASEAETAEIAEGARSDEESPLAAEVAQLRAEIDGIRQESNQNHERWLRAMAELENTRKRAKRELETSLNLANATLLRELLDVADNFERALSSLGESEDPAAKGFEEGVRLIYGQFADVLKQSGLSRIEAKGQPFDPNLHEAVSQIETDEVPSHHVVEVVQEGYLLRDMVLRPARVVVAG